MKDALVKTKNLFNAFVQSDWFIVFFGIMTYIAWAFGIWVPMLCALLAIVVLSLFLGKGVKQLFCFLMMFTMMISDNRHHLDDFLWVLIVFVVLLFAGLIFNLLYYHRHFESLQPRKIKGFHACMIALIIPFPLGGLGSPYESPLAVVAGMGIILLIALGYTFFMITLKDEDNKANLMSYMLKILFVLGVVISAQAITYYLSLGTENILKAITSKNLKLGWAGPNNVAPVLSMAVPTGFYFSLKKNKLVPLFLITSVIEYVVILFSGCRGAILFTTLLLPLMVTFTASKTENKGLFAASFTGIFALAIVFVALKGELVAPIITTILNKGLNSSGRVENLYPMAMETFKTWPIFGAGWDYKLGEMANDNYSPYWYHSTILQVFANMGICGVIVFVFFYFWRYRTFLELRKNTAALTIMISLLLFDLYGMIDTNFFGPTFFIMLACMTVVVEANIPENRCTSALIMVCVSVGLTLISGLIPAQAAAKKDPVIALRTE